MANESVDFLVNSPKRMKLDTGEGECDSSPESGAHSTEYMKCDEENPYEGGEMSTPVSSECDEKKVDAEGEGCGLEKKDNDDASSTVSNLSDLSVLSEMSGQHWKPISNSLNWLEKMMLKGVRPRIVLNQITGENTDLPNSVSDLDLWRAIFLYLSEPPKRSSLPGVHSLDHAVELIRTSKRIMVLTGAGVSVSCGIPDFRSKDGVYARLAIDFPNLPDPQAMFDIQFFRQDPRPFFKFAKEIYPGQFQPSPSHRFIKAIERHKKLLRNYTQNIDTLERVAGIENVIECHGSFATASCTICSHKVDADEIKETIFAQAIPYCTKCNNSKADTESEKGIMKPDIVFFGEGLPVTFHDAMASDKDQCDLLIVIGSSLKVRPVALIPSSIPGKVPQILINRERLPYMNFDVELLGDSDVIIDHLCRKLGGDWEEVCWRKEPLQDRIQPDMLNYSTDYDSGSSDREGDDEPSQILKCQKIGRRHIGGGGGGGGGRGTAQDPTSTPTGTQSEETGGSRHISLDSSRDSGIGENSNNSTDQMGSGYAPGARAKRPALLIPEDKDNCFFCIGKRRYVFPGAEVPQLSSCSPEEDDC